jgi:hypothetical protein
MIYLLKEEKKMYKITVQSYSKDSPDFFLVDEIKTIRNNSGLTLKVKIKNNWITIFNGFDGEYNPYYNSMSFNSLSCTDEFKDLMNYNNNSISTINIEYIGG